MGPMWPGRGGDASESTGSGPCAAALTGAAPLSRRCSMDASIGGGVGAELHGRDAVSWVFLRESKRIRMRRLGLVPLCRIRFSHTRFFGLGNTGVELGAVTAIRLTLSGAPAASDSEDPRWMREGDLDTPACGAVLRDAVRSALIVLLLMGVTGDVLTGGDGGALSPSCENGAWAW